MRHLRRAEDRQSGAADVAAEGEAVGAIAAADVEHDPRGAEDVAGLEEGGLDVAQRIEAPVVMDAPEELHAPLGVLHRVERLIGLRLAPGLSAAPGQPLGVLLLDVGAVAQHHPAQVLRRRWAVDGAGESLLGQVRQIAAVVDVGV